MKPTGKVEIIMGRKLYELEHGFYRDDTGRLYDYRLGKLYCQKRPGVWYWIQPPPVVPEPQDFGPYDDREGF
jgi:hypothetical protein